MRVLVAGCGYVGTELGLRLAADGHEVWGLRRAPGELPAPIRPVTADLTIPATLDRLPSRLDAVVYAVSADASEPAAYRAAYVAGLEHLEAALARESRPGAPPPRLVFISSTAVYGEHGGETVDEATPPDPTNFRGEILLEAERVARERDGETVIVRASGIYGPGRDRLLRLAAQGGLEGGDRWTNRIHRDDLAEAIRHVLTRATPSPLYLASDREPARLRDVLKGLAAVIDVPWEGAEARPNGAPAGAEIPGKRCVPRRLLDEGFAFEFPTWREGYRSVVGSTSRSRTDDQHISGRVDSFHLDRDDSGRVVSR